MPKGTNVLFRQEQTKIAEFMALHREEKEYTMKKYALILAVALLASPAFAAVQIIAVDADGAGAGLVADISYNNTAGEKVAAFALNISVDAGSIQDISNFHVGVSVAGDAGYGIFPANFDRFITVNGQGDVTDWGVAGYTPAADPNDKGAAGTGLGTSAIIVEMGALYKGDGNAPGTSGTLCSVTCSEACNLTVTLDQIRGNVVLEGATEATADLTGATNIPIGGGECLAPTAPGYADWVALGKPECWCIKTQCKGDADGLKEGSAKKGFFRVHFDDLNVLLAGWNTLEPNTGGTSGPGILTVTGPKGEAGVCADFAHDQEGSAKKGFYRVHFNDLNLLISNWNVAEPTIGPGIAPDCPGTSIDPQP